MTKKMMTIMIMEADQRYHYHYRLHDDWCCCCLVLFSFLCVSFPYLFMSFLFVGMMITNEMQHKSMACITYHYWFGRCYLYNMILHNSTADNCIIPGPSLITVYVVLFRHDGMCSICCISIPILFFSLRPHSHSHN